MGTDKKKESILKKAVEKLVKNILEPVLVQKIKDTENQVLDAITRLIRHCKEKKYNADVTLTGIKMFIEIATKENSR